MYYRLGVGALLAVGIDMGHYIMAHLALARLGNLKINIPLHELQAELSACP